jgi:hypothetical protein
MATIRKRGTKWQVQVRRVGHRSISASFNVLKDARAWARQRETEVDRGALAPDAKCLRRLTLGELVERYRDTVSVAKRGHEVERIVLNAFLRHPICRKPLSDLRMSLAIAYWLQQDHGVEGVWDRLQHISASYRSLQAENEEHDLLTLVVLAVYELAAEAGADIVVATRAIAQRVNQIATGDGDGWDIGPDEVQRVGRMMKRLGFEKSASHGRSRSWRLSRRKIEDMAKGRSIALGLQLKAA